MSVNSITQANGADLLNLYSESVGQGGTAMATDVTANALKKALAEAQLSASEILNGGTGNGSAGGQVNLYA